MCIEFFLIFSILSCGLALLTSLLAALVSVVFFKFSKEIFIQLFNPGLLAGMSATLLVIVIGYVQSDAALDNNSKWPWIVIISSIIIGVTIGAFILKKQVHTLKNKS
jgi:predicted membrane protein